MDKGDGAKKTSKKLKLFKDESGPSLKRWLRSDAKKSSDKVGASDGNSDGDWKKAKIETGKGKKRKYEDGLEKPSKRRLVGDQTDHSDEAVAREHGEKAIIDLPGELLTKIIDIVPISQWSSLELVSRSFQGVVHGLWGQQREIRLDEFVYRKEKEPCQVVETALSKFLNRAPNVASISGFGEFFDIGNSIRSETILLLSKFEHLQTIDFSGGYVVSSRNFAAFLESSASRQSWKRLDIVGGIYGTMGSNDAVVIQNQSALNLECFKFEMDTFSLFARFLPIEWSGLKKLDVSAWSPSAKEVLSIIRQCIQITHLKIVVPKCGNGNGQPSYGNFMQAVAELENLSVLKIVGYSPWDCPGGMASFQDALLALIQDLGRRGITDLALVACCCSDQIIGAIIDHLPSLKSLVLDMPRCTTASLVRLANTMGQLESLKFRSRSDNHSLDSSVIQAIGGNMSELRRLRINYPDGNSKDFISLGNLRKLKELRFTGRFKDCGNIGTWANLGFGECMESLELSIQAGIHPERVVKFFKNMPRLSRLKLRGAIGRKGIMKAIAESCPNLVELHLGYSRTITSTAVQSVINRCAQLKILKVCGHEWFPESLAVEKYRKITFKSKWDE